MTLAERTIAAAGWNYLGTAARVIGQLITQILLARLVGPQAFGIIALAILPVLLSCIVVDLGLGAALVQQRNPSQADIQAVWARTTFTGLIVTAILYLGAQPLSILLGNPQTTAAIRCLSPVALLYGITVVPLAILRRQLDMKWIQFSQLGAYLTGFMGVGVISAWSGAGVWALVAAWITYYAVAFVLTLHFSKLRVRFKSPFHGAEHLNDFGKRIMFTNLFNWTVENLDNFAVGRFFGAQALGIYSVSYNLTRTPANHIVTNLQSALFPASARMQDNTANLQRGYLSVVSAVSLLAIPVFLSMAVVSQTLILALFGAKWQGATGVIVPLSIAMIFHVIMAVSGPILAGKGSPEIEFHVQLWTGLLFIGILIAAAKSSVLVIAWGVLAIYIIRMIWMTTALLRSLMIKSTSFFKILYGPVLLGVVVAGTIWTFDNSGLMLNHSARLALEVIMSGLVMLIMLMWKPNYFISDELRGVLIQVIGTRPSLKGIGIIRRLVA